MQEKRKSVVVVADVPYLRRLLQKHLSTPDVLVRAAGSHDEAIAALTNQGSDLAVVDLVNTPGGSEQLLLALRVAGCHVPVLLLCTSVDRDMLRRLNNLQPVGFLLKPLRYETLVELLPAALRADPNLLRLSAEMAAPKGRSGTSSAAAAAAGLGETSKEPVDAARLAVMFGHMPLLPHVLTQILSLTDEAGSAQALAQIISSDPRLSGQLLRVVNSAYFGFSRRIATIPEATVILGSEAIRKLAVGASVSSFFGGKGAVLDRARLWRHALATAVASRLVLERVGSREAEDAFAAGLLHDFGRLALERHFAAPYAAAVAAAHTSDEPLLAAEERLLGITHAWVGGWLAQKWNLPAVLGQAMTWHHQPEQAAEGARTVAAAAHVGDMLCHLAGYGGIEDLPAPVADAYAFGVLGLPEADVEGLVPVVAREAQIIEQQLAAAVAAE